MTAQSVSAAAKAPPLKPLRAAVDVGGTFIDVVVADRRSRRVEIAKVLHRPGSQGEAIGEALCSLAAALGAGVADIDSLVIGTTVVTNALLEGKLAATALIATDGFSDVIEIARMTRPASYDLRRRRPTPIVSKERRLEIKERLAFDGSVVTPLDDGEIVRMVSEVRRLGIQAVAVCLLYSYVDPTHERRIGEALKSHGVPVSLSSDVLPMFREYERTVATTVNAATMQVMARFLDGIASFTEQSAIQTYIMGSGNGCMTLAEARRFPIKCAMSGPAGGVVGAGRFRTARGIGAMITLDVGGTSSDVAMLSGDVLPLTESRAIGGYPVAVPSVEVETIGAGGGSIAFIDPTGLLKVGPLSAGAIPGPVCYGLGGTKPTVTDAHVALNRLASTGMLSGAFALDRAAAVEAIERDVGRPLGFGWVRAAQGILEVTTANIVRAVRAMSVERGHDPRNMSLFAFGGAGPLHALDVARTLGIPEVIVPHGAGVWSAYGILSIDIQYAMQRTWLRGFDAAGSGPLDTAIEAIAAELRQRARSDGLDAATLTTNCIVDLRVRGQSHFLSVPLSEATAEGVEAAIAAFHAEHMRRYGHAFPDLPAEIVNIRVAVTAPRPAFDTAVEGWSGNSEPHATREIWLGQSEESRTCPVYSRSALASGAEVSGPAIVEQYDTTIVLDGGDRLRVCAETQALLIEIAATTQ